jgi:hypothetical protein
MPDYLLLESGDHLLSEGADRLLLESSVAGPVQFAGLSTLTLTTSATLTGTAAAFAGLSTLTLTTTGALRAGGAQFAGTSSLTLTTSGTLSVTGGAAFNGTSSLTLTTTGTLTGQPVQFAGRSQLTLTTAGALVTYPGFRPLRSAAIQRPVGRIEQTAPGPTTPLPQVLRFTLDSSLDTPADGWTAEVAGAALLLAPDDEALYRLPVGFLDDAGHEVLAAHITSGRILDRRLVGRATERRTYVRGLDALERTFRTLRRVRYVPDGTAVPALRTQVDVLQPALSARQAELQSVRRDPAWPTPDLEARAARLTGAVRTLEQELAAAQADAVEEKVGAWSARTIAADLLVGTGLTLAWSARDYSFSVPFDAVGPLYDLLRRLVEPWNQAPPLGVDITAFGTVLHVRPRLLAPPADLTLTVAESRLVELELGDRRRLPFYGVVSLEGRIDDGTALDGGDTTIFPPIGLIASTEVTVPYAADTPTGRVEGTRTYRMPDEILVHELERVYTLSPNGQMYQTAETESGITYEDSRYGPGGAILNQPLPLSAEKFIQTLVEQEDVLVLWHTGEERRTWTYDVQRLLEATTTRRSQYYNSGGLIGMFEVEAITESYGRKLDGWVEVKTVRTTFDPKTGAFASSATLHAQDRAGLPPGGPRPPFSLFGARVGDAEGAPLAYPPVRLRATISTDTTARPASYSNPNLAGPDLEFIMGQFRAVSGLVEYPLRGAGPALPDVIKGSAIHLTDYADADGTPIPLDPAQVRRIGFDYEDAAGFTCAIDAIFYRPD